MKVVVLEWEDATKLVVFSLGSAIEEMVSVAVLANGCELSCIGVRMEDSGSIFGRTNGSERKHTCQNKQQNPQRKKEQ